MEDRRWREYECGAVRRGDAWPCVAVQARPLSRREAASVRSRAMRSLPSRRTRLGSGSRTDWARVEVPWRRLGGDRMAAECSMSRPRCWSRRRPMPGQAAVAVLIRWWGAWVAIPPRQQPSQQRGRHRSSRYVSTSLAALPLTPAGALAPPPLPRDKPDCRGDRPSGHARLRPSLLPPISSRPPRHLLLRRILWRKEDQPAAGRMVNARQKCGMQLKLRFYGGLGRPCDPLG